MYFFIGKARPERFCFMKALISLVIFLCALMGSINFAEPAETIRCGTRLISEGDPKERLLNECGPPSNVEAWEEERYYHYDAPPPAYLYKEYEYYGSAYRVKVLVRVEVWTYNYGPSRFIDYVRIENGKVRKIYSGGYGY
jgi:hypothetical protein